MNLLKRMAVSVLGSDRRTPSGPADARAYAIGDIHGRLDLLTSMLGEVEADINRGSAQRVFVVFLGDYIDRGPESRGVIQAVLDWAPKGIEKIFLIGNHEEILLRLLDQEPELIGDWLHFGGASCAKSYGLDPAELANLSSEMAAKRLDAAIPADHREFLESLNDTFRFGDFLFAHAGVRPGVALLDQRPADLRWIRDAFLDDRSDHGFVVVHGHTIVGEIEDRGNRIAIDTGAYKTGRLAALVIEGPRKRYLFATDEKISVVDEAITAKP